MAKMTKTQKKNALESIRMKAFNLVKFDLMSVNDYAAIQRITNKYLNKL
tara:strand:+ start:2415 stop:2561 length:147 start_codon:yes stop_codon:yes gene_type:complete